MPAGNEGVNLFLNAKEHVARRHRGAETEKKTKELLISNLCVSARDCLFFHIFWRYGLRSYARYAGYES